MPPVAGLLVIPFILSVFDALLADVPKCHTVKNGHWTRIDGDERTLLLARAP